MKPNRRTLPRQLILSLALAGALGGQAGATDLMDAFELARSSDPQLAAAEATSLASREGVVISRSALLPQISGSASLTDTDGSSRSRSLERLDDGSFIPRESSGASDSRARNYSVNLSQSIYDHGNYTRLRASRARADRSQADYDAAQQGLMLRVSESYFSVLTAIDSLAFARAEQRAVKRQLDQAEQRFEVGLTAITDVHEARARYDGSRAAAIAASNALDDQREFLAEITGRYVENLRGLGDTFKPQLPEPANAGKWVDVALKASPSLRASELALLAAGHDVETARSGHLPRLSLSAGRSNGDNWGEASNFGFSIPTSGSSQGNSIGLTLSVPIFSGFATQAGLRQAIYSRDATQDRYEQDRRAVTRSVRNAYRALEAGISEIAAREQALVSARSALEATEAGFEVGTRTIVDVLLSQQQLFQAQRDYSQARHNFLVNGLRLKTAAGDIQVNDIKRVNALLTTDAEAALAEEPAAEG